MCPKLGLRLVLILMLFGGGILQPLQSGPQECQDVLFPGTETCDIVLKQNLCGKPYIKGKYCVKSCKECQDPCDDPEALYCDVEGLMAFKNSLTEGRDVLSSWTGDFPCSGWKHVTCEFIHGKNGRVTNISNEFQPTAFQNKMVGELAQDLTKIKYIKEIQLSYIKFNNQLPEEFSVFQNLTTFVLRNTSILGQLPTSYGTWSQIKVFVISNNRLIGTIPKEYSQWKQMQNFQLKQNQLISGQIWPNFSMWKQIRYFSVDQNGITGTLPKEFTEWKQIQQITTSENQLIGTLPQDYSILKKLIGIDLTNNSLTGSLPTEYSLLTNCETFRMSENLLTGTLPPQYSTLTLMKYFYFISNNIRGTLPKEYSTMLRLKKFVGYQNKIQAFDQQTYLQNYNVSCYIPQEWSQIRKNTYINVTFNFVQTRVCGVDLSFIRAWAQDIVNRTYP